MLNIVLNWRCNLSNLPSAATGRGKRSEPKKNSALAGADVGRNFCSFVFPC